MKRKYTVTIEFESDMSYLDAAKLVDSMEDLVCEANNGDFGSIFGADPPATDEENQKYDEWFKTQNECYDVPDEELT